VKTEGRGKYVQADRLNIYYEEYGTGRPLVLLHGGTQTGASWREFLPLLTPHFRVFTPDSRGHGRTNNPALELSYRLMAADIAGFIQKLGIESPFILGYSDGGQIALQMAMDYPGLTRAFAAGGIYYQLTGPIVKFIKSLGFVSPGVLDFDIMARLDPEFADSLRADHVSSSDPEYWKILLEQLSRMWWTPLDYTEEDFKKITEPFLVLAGDRDNFCPVQQAVDMYHFIPDAELAVFPNTTHATALTATTLPVVIDFFLRRGAD
jgi:pimeloyl-ACP methyl ester carboxylesterase